MVSSRKRISTARPWSNADKQQLLELRAQHRSWDNIAKSFPGRTADACKQLHNIMLREAQGLFRPKVSEPRKVNGRIHRTADDVRLMAERPAPLPEYTSITAEFFGDPRPGRSALDRLRSGMST